MNTLVNVPGSPFAVKFQPNSLTWSISMHKTTIISLQKVSWNSKSKVKNCCWKLENENVAWFYQGTSNWNENDSRAALRLWVALCQPFNSIQVVAGIKYLTLGTK